MKGTLIANNSAITLGTGVNLEGRAMSTSGAISVNGIEAVKPMGCGSPVLTGPIAPDLNSAICYTIFSSNGAVANSGITNLTGDVGTNVGLTTGFDPLLVNGMIHPVPDTSTNAAAQDLLLAYTYINTLPFDIQLLYPAQFGNDLVLTPHTYLLNAATALTGDIYLNGQDNEDAVFVIQINGAFSTSTNSKVILINGTQAKNVYWKVDGAVLINDFSEFKGTLICNNGAVEVTTGAQVNGRIMTTDGAISTAAITSVMTVGCGTMGLNDFGKEVQAAQLYPNPFTDYLNVVLTDGINSTKTELIIHDALGRQVKTVPLSTMTTTIDVSDFPAGFYFYKILTDNKILQSGSLIAQ